MVNNNYTVANRQEDISKDSISFNKAYRKLHTKPSNTDTSDDISWTEALMSTYPSLDSKLIKRQVELECLMRAEGLLRYDNEISKAQKRGLESNTSYGRVLMTNYVNDVAISLQEQLEVIIQGKAGCSNNNLRLIKNIEAHITAYIALRTVIDSINTPQVLQNLARSIGINLEAEAKCRHFEAKAKEAYKIAMKKEERCTVEFKKRLAINAMMKAVTEGRYSGTPNPELHWESWSISSLVGIGTKLIQLIAKNTGLITVYMSSHLSKKGNRLYSVKASQALDEWIKAWIHQSGLMAPFYMPCVIPPKPYTTPSNGGYHTGQVNGVPLIKIRDKGYYDVISTPEAIERMSSVYEAVNTAQNTAWQINKKVLQVFKELWRNDIPVECLPRQEDYPLPVCPKCQRPTSEDVNHKGWHKCFDEDKEALKQWKKHASITHMSNQSAFSKRLSIHRILWIAEQYKNDAAIYFPYQLDFRGRIYSVPKILNPQGSDHAKGLLMFANPKPIKSKSASDWLAIHVANTYGNDKLSFEDRIKWTEDNTSMIQAIADDPIENRRYWTDTDSPFCFLAACFEWSEFKKQGYGYMSCLPIAQDGTCSGLQHYSALLRDSVGGAAVNLIPTDKPQDIYKVVADKTIKVLESFTLDDSTIEDYTLAQEWLCSGLITRKLTKRAVMTLPYGSTMYSAKAFIREHIESIREQSPERIPWPLIREVMSVEEYNTTAYEEGVESSSVADPTAKACAWLGAIVWQCIHSTVIAASEAMNWLKTVATVVSSDNGLPLSWLTPTGFLVLQRYNLCKARRIKTQLAGDLVYRTTDTQDNKIIKTTFKEPESQKPVLVYLTLPEETDQIDTKSQKQGIAPNFIHSMDASALVFAVNHAHRHHGIKDFALIHDSFGTHAGGEGIGDSARLAESIRSSFVEMYEKHDVLNDFNKTMTSCLTDSKGIEDAKSLLPELPSRGTLNIRDVMKSKYFFS